MSKLTKKQVALLISLLLIAVLSFFGIQMLTSERPPLPEAVAALESDSLVKVAQEPWLTWSPTEGSADTGFIFV